MMTEYILLAVAVVLVVWAVLIYNELVSRKNRGENAFAQIDVQLKRRYDLIPNLVETAKGYLSHETRNFGSGDRCAQRSRLFARQNVRRFVGCIGGTGVGGGGIVSRRCARQIAIDDGSVSRFEGVRKYVAVIRRVVFYRKQSGRFRGRRITMPPPITILTGRVFRKCCSPELSDTAKTSRFWNSPTAKNWKTHRKLIFNRALFAKRRNANR